MSLSSLSVAKHFARLRDRRRNHCKRHLLMDIIVIALCATICGANNWQQIATFAQRRHDWLKTFLALPNGIPSHDTFERVFDLVDPQAFLACFQRWVEALTHGLGLKHVAIDGKTMRHSGNATKKLRPLHIVSAWATECHLTLGQVAVDDKSNEITAIPQLLELLDVHGALVTIDAMGCQKAIAKKIVDGGGDYVLSVKGNQPNLLADIQETIAEALDSGQENVAYHTYETKDTGHGREEMRSYVIVTDLDKIRDRKEWAELKVIGMYTSTRIISGKRSDEAHYLGAVATASRNLEGKYGSRQPDPRDWRLKKRGSFPQMGGTSTNSRGKDSSWSSNIRRDPLGRQVQPRRRRTNRSTPSANKWTRSSHTFERSW